MSCRVLPSSGYLSHSTVPPYLTLPYWRSSPFEQLPIDHISGKSGKHRKPRAGKGILAIYLGLLGPAFDTVALY